MSAHTPAKFARCSACGGQTARLEGREPDPHAALLAAAEGILHAWDGWSDARPAVVALRAAVAAAKGTRKE